MNEIKRWYEKSGQEGDVVISTRVRLARNLQKMPFPARMQDAQRREVEQKVRDAVEHSSAVLAKSLHYRELDDFTKTEAVSLVERHLVSPEFVSNTKGRALLLAGDESISIMVNEEDHVRMQVMLEGFQLDQAYQIANALDDALNSTLHFAFDKNLGYLTQCPTNLGTGMRASVMLHLPALQESGAMNRMAGNLSKLGLTLRGTYGEGTEAVGALYQLSNQVSLGLSEKEAIANLSSIAMQLVEQERKARDVMAHNISFQDSVFRAVAILKNARMLSSEEFMQLISPVRLGIATGLLTNLTYDKINALIVSTQPASMSLAKGGTLNAQQRDEFRASMVAQALR